LLVNSLVSATAFKDCASIFAPSKASKAPVKSAKCKSRGQPPINCLLFSVSRKARYVDPLCYHPSPPIMHRNHRNFQPPLVGEAAKNNRRPPPRRRPAP
jgi:hypothetical protein